MPRHFSNGWASAITAVPNAGATSITPASVAGAPATPFDARIRNATLTGDGLHFTKEELVSVTLVSGGVCTIARASEAIHDGSQVAMDFTGGPAVIEHVVTAGAVGEIAPGVRVIYAECNSPAAGSGYVLWDTFYDKAQAAISGAPLTAALAALGLTYNAGTGEFTATADLVLSVELGITIAAAPGGADDIQLYHPGWDPNPTVLIPNPNTLGAATLGKRFAILVGENFRIQKTCANGGDTPLTYAAMNILRLV